MRTFFLSLLAGLVMICIPLHRHAQDDLDFQKLMKEVDSSEIFISDSFYTWIADADHPSFENNTFNICFLLK